MPDAPGLRTRARRTSMLTAAVISLAALLTTMILNLAAGAATTARSASATDGRPQVPSVVASGTLGAAASAEPSARPSARPSASPGGPAVALFGPFGQLDGVSGPADAPWPEGTMLYPLDAHGRGARLVAQPRDLDLGFLDWHLSARPLMDADPAALIELGRGPVGERDVAYAVVDAPPAGSWLLRLDATLGALPAASWFWQVRVPDADVPPPGEPFPPVPGIHLSSAGSSLDMALGSGCFIGTCADIGAPPAVDQLPTLTAATTGPEVTVTLSDGSGIAAWDVSMRPAIGSGATHSTAGEAAGLGQSQVTFKGPGPGRWLVELDLTFDLGRGAYTAYALLRVP